MLPSQPHNATRNLNSQFEDYECGNQEFELDDDETAEVDVSTIPNPSAIRGKKGKHLVLILMNLQMQEVLIRRKMALNHAFGHRMSNLS